MKKSIKKLVSLALATVLFTSATTVFAAEPPTESTHPLVQSSALLEDGSVAIPNAEIQPRWTYISRIAMDLTVTNRVIRYEASLSCYNLVSGCSIEGSLQRWNGSSWVEYRSWTANSNSNHAGLDKYVSVPAGEYCGVGSFSATYNGHTELTQHATASKTVS
ncbi:hypothetical protein [Hydrogeniiclostridium mannosilyticum]|uniref:hypothetical protein n=1 Tax=Hydrogeniiclostridium mannosilyticum TaxID=2764322 RepID=UPI0018AB0F5B|nr:hypothetical protein [Hydrogeniiclostridium mannosilyticum]